MSDEKVAGGDPVAARQQLRKLGLDAVRISGGRPAEALRQAADVGIDDHRRNLEGGAEDDVGGLASDAGEGDQLAKGGWDLAVVVLHQPLRTADEVAGLGMVKAGGTDQFFDLAELRLTEVGGIGVAGKEAGGDEIDAPIGTLGGKDGGNEELKGGAMRQRTLGGRINFCQAVKEGGRSPG